MIKNVVFTLSNRFDYNMLETRSSKSKKEHKSLHHLRVKIRHCVASLGAA